MEDASKALLIAAGVLFAILTISFIGVLSNNITTMENSRDEAEEAKQLAKFNAQYEVFRKDKLYGTEVITAVNKVIENNNMTQDDTDPWYINVMIDTGMEEYKSTVYRVEKDKPYNKKEIMFNNLPQEVKDDVSYASIKGKIGLLETGDKVEVNNNMVSFFKDNLIKDSQVEIEEADGKKYIYYIYSPLKTFKTSIFVGEVIYEDGRIKELVFTLE